MSCQHWSRVVVSSHDFQLPPSLNYGRTVRARRHLFFFP